MSLSYFITFAPRELTILKKNSESIDKQTTSLSVTVLY
jgi:hypothetical protein